MEPDPIGIGRFAHISRFEYRVWRGFKDRVVSFPECVR